ncbi:MAG: hypothetical protein IKH81_05275 [Clostridia bacterium]|nr:hypothetical protein [Clostridia bacterium]
MWSIWITAGVTWLLAGLSCILRYVSWRKKADAKPPLTEEEDNQNAAAAQP